MNKVTRYFDEKGLPLTAIFTGQDTSTVQKAAGVLGVEDGQIAKSLAVQLPGALAPAGVGVLVTMGTARLDNRKYKDCFGVKASLLNADETLDKTGHAVGGVCPFALPDGVRVFLDESLRRYTHVYPAAGTRDSAVKVEVARLAGFTGGTWVDVCKCPE
jgi:prolyl-tRNA editing enzyme YbaK/EbsC (Cys-tRNA(Pro) deacylase)